MYQLRPTVFIGGHRHSSDLQLLLDNKITAVFNGAYDIDDPLYPPDTIRYIKVGLMDNSNNSDYMKELAVVILERMILEKEVVLVHCAAGLSHSVYIACQAVANLEKKHPDDILNELKRIHPFAMRGGLWDNLSSPLVKDLRKQEAIYESSNTTH